MPGQKIVPSLWFDTRRHAQNQVVFTGGCGS